MKSVVFHTLTFLFFSFLFLSCKKEKQPSDLRILAQIITKEFQSLDTKAIRDRMFNLEFYDSTESEQSVIKFGKLIAKENIDTFINFNVQQHVGVVNEKGLSKDTILIIQVMVPLGIQMPSLIPKYYLEVTFTPVKEQFKIFGFDLKTTTTSEDKLIPLPVYDKFPINTWDIKSLKLMYEGGYKNPMVFKSLTLDNENEISKEIIPFLNELRKSEIIAHQFENQSKKFNGDPELGILTFDMKNGYTWTFFLIVSEDVTEYKAGLLEVRFYKYLNDAVTYWVSFPNEEKVKSIFLELCHKGENIRKEARHSIKLEMEAEKNQ